MSIDPLTVVSLPSRKHYLELGSSSVLANKTFKRLKPNLEDVECLVRSIDSVASSPINLAKEKYRTLEEDNYLKDFYASEFNGLKSKNCIERTSEEDAYLRSLLEECPSDETGSDQGQHFAEMFSSPLPEKAQEKQGGRPWSTNEIENLEQFVAAYQAEHGNMPPWKHVSLKLKEQGIFHSESACNHRWHRTHPKEAQEKQGGRPWSKNEIESLEQFVAAYQAEHGNMPPWKHVSLKLKELGISHSESACYHLWYRIHPKNDV